MTLNRLCVRVLLRGLSSLFGFQPLRLAALHGPIVRMRLFVVLAAWAAEKEQDRLRVGTAHVASLRRWPVVVKRTTIPLKTIHFDGDSHG
jgi:hypothetical protein